DEAWEVYNELLTTYFRVKNNDIDETEAMIQYWNLPRTFSESLKQLADKYEENEKLQIEISKLQPKAEKFDNFLAASNI
ncbi:hypothetical protein, partial [Escherichia coli]|uniref:hypothetical protein n=1 Tax=Escherichia coli TaxID=562 RepID=UPI003EC128D0